MLESIFLVLELSTEDFYLKKDINSLVVKEMIKNPEPTGMQIDVPIELDRKHHSELPFHVSLKHHDKMKIELSLSKQLFAIHQSTYSGEIVITLPFQSKEKMPVPGSSAPILAPPGMDQTKVTTNFDTKWVSLDKSIINQPGIIFSNIMWGNMISNTVSTHIINENDTIPFVSNLNNIDSLIRFDKSTDSPDLPESPTIVLNALPSNNGMVYGSYHLTELGQYSVVKAGLIPITLLLNGQNFGVATKIKAFVPIDNSDIKDGVYTGYFSVNILNILNEFFPNEKQIPSDNFISVICLGIQSEIYPLSFKSQ